MTAAALHEALLTSWSLDTGRHWTAESPARGQCSVTALVARERLGGDLLKTRVGTAWHFYNRVDGARLDLTEAQFPEPIAYDDLPATDAETLADTSPAQVAALRAAIAARLDRSAA